MVALPFSPQEAHSSNEVAVPRLTWTRIFSQRSCYNEHFYWCAERLQIDICIPTARNISTGDEVSHINTKLSCLVFSAVVCMGPIKKTRKEFRDLRDSIWRDDQERSL